MAHTPRARRNARAIFALAVVASMLLATPSAVAAAVPPMPADAFGSATPLDIDNLPDQTLTVDVSAATFEDGERLPCAPEGTTARTVWYRFTYPMTNAGRVEVVTTGARVTAFYLPSGSGIADLSAGYCRDSSSLAIPWFAGRTEYVQIAADEAVSSITVSFRFVLRPPNDDLAAARWIYLGEDVAVDTRIASVEVVGTTPKPYDIPLGSCTNRWGRSTWYVFMAQQAGTAVIDPTGSTFGDAVLTAWNGNPLYASRVACSKNSQPLAFHVEAYYLYWIQAVDAGSGGGTLHLTWSMDTLPPVLSLPSDITVEATDATGARVTYPATAIDAVDGALPVHCYRPSGSQFPIGATRVSCWAQDAALNFAYEEFWVSVVDSRPPVLPLSDVVAEATGPAGAAVQYVASAVDAIDGPVPAYCSPPPGSVFSIGTTTVWCTASDNHGNLGTGQFSLTVRDTTPPVVSYSQHPAVYALSDAIHVSCSATDAVGVATGTCAGVDGYGWELGLGLHRYAASATDAAGNVGSAATELTVIATYRSMSDLTRSWLTKAGVAKDLVAILDAAAAAEARGQYQAEAGKLSEYRSMIQSQSGKSVTPARAQLLVAFTYGL